MKKNRVKILPPMQVLVASWNHAADSAQFVFLLVLFDLLALYTFPFVASLVLHFPSLVACACVVT